MTLHDQLLAALLEIADVSLVASLRDARLGLPDAGDLRVFLGDMHLISDRRQLEVGYTYGVNHEPLLVEVVRAVRGLKTAAEARGGLVTLYQMGDFLDVWREAPGFDRSFDAAARIKDDHEDLVTALMDRATGTRFLFGNHDLGLYRWPAYRDWARRIYLPAGPGQTPRVLVTHGDVFDMQERHPDLVKNLAVYYFSPKDQTPTFELGVVESLTVQEHGARTYQAAIRDGAPPEMGPFLRLGDRDVPAAYNVQREGEAPGPSLQYLAEARSACQAANDTHGLALGVMVIGHTHHARIAISTAEGPPITLVDCGAWIERNLSGGQPLANAQVTALGGDEARIYQLAPRGTTAGMRT